MGRNRQRKKREPVSVRAALLQSLIEGPGYGLELIKRVKDQTEGRMVIGQGALYPTLWDLQEEGLVTCYETDPMPERGGRPRKYYELTADGLRSAREEQILGRLLFGVRREAPT